MNGRYFEEWEGVNMPIAGNLVNHRNKSRHGRFDLFIAVGCNARNNYTRFDRT
jgi:hypothetical protein